MDALNLPIVNPHSPEENKQMSLQPTDILKTDIINYLGQTWNYRSYLEICTPTTGCRYPRIDRSTFDLCHRLMYRCPGTFRDGWKIDFRSETLDIAELVTTIQGEKFSYDVILVDPWHEYETSYRDLAIAASLISTPGTIVVHDCLPPTETIAGPQFSPGSWCGVTYKAFLDFVFSRSDLSYFTETQITAAGSFEKIATWIAVSQSNPLGPTNVICLCGAGGA